MAEIRDQEAVEPEPEVQVTDESEVWYLATIMNIEVTDIVQNIKIVKEIIVIDDSETEEAEEDPSDDDVSGEDWWEVRRSVSMYLEK